MLTSRGIFKYWYFRTERFEHAKWKKCLDESKIIIQLIKFDHQVCRYWTDIYPHYVDENSNLSRDDWINHSVLCHKFSPKLSLLVDQETLKHYINPLYVCGMFIFSTYQNWYKVARLCDRHQFDYTITARQYFQMFRTSIERDSEFYSIWDETLQNDEKSMFLHLPLGYSYPCSSLMKYHVKNQSVIDRKNGFFHTLKCHKSNSDNQKHVQWLLEQGIENITIDCRNENKNTVLLIGDQSQASEKKSGKCNNICDCRLFLKESTSHLNEIYILLLKNLPRIISQDIAGIVYDYLPWFNLNFINKLELGRKSQVKRKWGVA